MIIIAIELKTKTNDEINNKVDNNVNYKSNKNNIVHINIKNLMII